MRKLMIAVAAAAIAAVVSGGAVSAEHEKEVKVKGSEDFEPNALFKSNFSVCPRERSQYTSGNTVTWIDKDKLNVPHTITIVDPEAFPGELFRSLLVFRGRYPPRCRLYWALLAVSRSPWRVSFFYAGCKLRGRWTRRSR